VNGVAKHSDKRSITIGEEDDCYLMILKILYVFVDNVTNILKVMIMKKQWTIVVK